MKLFVLAAGLMKQEPGKTMTTVMSGYRLSNSEDEAKGSFLTAVMEKLSDYALTDLLCMTVPDDVIEQVIIDKKAINDLQKT